MARAVLTPFDEYPVHQTGRPLSQVASSEPSFDDGYFFAVYSPDADVFCFQGLRVNPNTGVVGGYAGVLHSGRQLTVRFSRPWDGGPNLGIGPYAMRIDEPMRAMHLSLAETGAGLAFELDWTAAAPVFEEARHEAWRGNRVVTDQTRYVQAGSASGWLEIGGRRFDVGDGWYAGRDHSWGLYAQRAPLAASQKWFAPSGSVLPRRALRFWVVGTAPGLSSFYAIGETPDGRQVPMNDTFGTPFEGRLWRGPDGQPVDLVAARHDITFQPGTRLIEQASVHLDDADGGRWVQTLRPAGMPWVPEPIGYVAGSWRDGGSLATYHGSPEPVVEWEELDVAEQPREHVLYNGFRIAESIGGEYMCRVETRAPDGAVTVGGAHLEFFLNGRYTPYGFED